MDWHHFIDLPSGRTPGKWEQPHLEQALPHLGIIPKETALDLGCLDGRWSFAMEALGASVTSVDVVSRNTYRQAHMELRSNARYVIGDAMLMEFPRCDVVWCSGLLYHVADPMYLLRKLRLATINVALIESAICIGGDTDCQSWIGNTYPNGDGSVAFVPSMRVLERWVSCVGFDIVASIPFHRDLRYALVVKPR